MTVENTQAVDQSAYLQVLNQANACAAVFKYSEEYSG